MRAFLRSLFRRKAANTSRSANPSRIPAYGTMTMSAASTSALLYAATVAVPTTPAGRPDDDLTNTKAWHLPNGRFTNPWASWDELSMWRMLSGMTWRHLSGKGNKPDTTPPTVPVREPTFLPSRTASPKLRATWLGHACYYVEFPSGLRVLFDPVFTHRCSPLSFIGPARFTKAPCEIKDIPTIDAVVISHSHYDHLSEPTVRDIAERHPECHFFVPLGNKKWFAETGITKCTELDWWDEVEVTLTPASASSTGTKEISVTPPSEASADTSSTSITAKISSLPCQHTANRGITDRAATLWSSWSVISGGKSVYFAGDTGYRSVPYESDGKDDWAEEYSHLPICPAFKEIGQLRGPFDLGLIPIGAYTPRWIMSHVHSNPRDAVEIFRDTKCHKALGMHWGTWVLTEEDVLEPPKLLRKALTHHKMPEEGVFDICDIGESREF